VADELGDPPRPSRYAELAAAREDLPSSRMVRARLGPWPGIAAALTEQQASRNDHRAAASATSPAAGATFGSAGHDRCEPARDGRANGARAAAESVGEGRLPTQVEVAALRHLARHPGSSGTEVKNGAGIRSGSQVWTLLARLEREGLLVNERSGSESAWKNAWRLSGRGRDVLSGLPEGMYA
jgi:hypothetical protein